jgi:hypothetical protein
MGLTPTGKHSAISVGWRFIAFCEGLSMEYGREGSNGIAVEPLCYGMHLNPCDESAGTGLLF